MQPPAEPAGGRVRELGRRLRATSTNLTIRSITRLATDEGTSPSQQLSPHRSHIPHFLTMSTWAGEALMGRYEIRRTIGHGGFGEVYEAYDVTDRELVAIKRVLWSTLFNLRKDKVAHRELELLRNLEHPHIVVYKDAFIDNGLYSSDLLLVMELCDRDLYSVIHHTKARLDTGTTVHYMACISSAIAYLHSEHIIHRDLKPQNVLMTKAGVPKVTDFGLACFAGGEAETQHKMRRTIAGTPQYTAPELGSGVYDDRVDIWGLGCIFYELLAWRHFERHRSADKLKVHPKLRAQLAAMLSEQAALRPTAQQCYAFFGAANGAYADLPEPAYYYWLLGGGLVGLYVLFLIFF